ncbi:MAG TPA: hypothetical protein VMW21_01470 [Patescibacteria group bacterium]|nr:hypothetical protein [Patescibacteria group bacterium]
MVEIIPKEPAKPSKTLNLLFYLAIFLLFFSVISYFILSGFLKKTEEEAAALASALVQTEESSLEKEILTAKKKIEDFSSLIVRHLTPSEVFEIVEKNCHPKVWFSQFSLSSREKTLKVSGETDNFETLGQQIFILEEETALAKVTLESFSITSEGRINFELSLTLNI